MTIDSYKAELRLSMKLCSIASGSSGNCIYAGNDNTNILVDVGVSAKRIENGLSSIDIKPDTVQAILVTHEHSDHISGLGVMSRKYHIPIYATIETAKAIMNMKNLGEIEKDLFHFIEPNETFMVNDISVNPFSTSHDASNSVCYTMQSNGRKVGIATDLGKFDDYIMSNLEDSDILMLEANHDVNMLMVGKYPYYLKQRILGDKGHLSNKASAELICKLMNSRLQHVILAHLSKENNYEELAYETVSCELHSQGCEFAGLSVANRDMPSHIVIA